MTQQYPDQYHHATDQRRVLTPPPGGTALAPIQPAEIRPFEPRGPDDLMMLAQELEHASLVPKALMGRPADIYLVMRTGHELGFGPLQSLRAFYIPEDSGRPQLYSEAMVALVITSPKCEYFRRLLVDDTKAIYETKRVGWPDPISFEYTIEMAQTAGLVGKKNWKQNPRTMMMQRAKSLLARDVYPDIVGGFFSDEELAYEGQSTSVSAEVISTVPMNERLAEALQDAAETVDAIPLPND